MAALGTLVDTIYALAAAQEWDLVGNAAARGVEAGSLDALGSGSDEAVAATLAATLAHAVSRAVDLPSPDQMARLMAPDVPQTWQWQARRLEALIGGAVGAAETALNRLIAVCDHPDAELGSPHRIRAALVLPVFGLSAILTRGLATNHLDNRDTANDLNGE